MAGGSFSWSKYLFRIENGSDLIGLYEPLSGEDLDERLRPTKRVPVLNGAPIASWILARLLHMTDDGFAREERERNDGGGYILDFVVYVDEGTPVAQFQLQGNTEGIALIGERSREHDDDDIVQAFADAILDRPTDLIECKHLIKDPEWRLDPEIYTPTPVKGSTNRYGWNGKRFLGKDNTRIN